MPQSFARLEADATQALQKAAGWLVAQQAADGGWHSETYGALRPGAAVTSLAIYSLSLLPEELQRYRDAMQRGFEFLRPGIDARGFVANRDGSLDYPTYGTTMLVTASRRLAFGLEDPLRQQLIRWILDVQLHPGRDFAADDPHLGGWDLIGTIEVAGVTTDSNVSATCYALESLAGEKEEDHLRAVELASDWLRRCQALTGDGGFSFTTDVESPGHKAGWRGNEDQAGNRARRPRSYGSTTADGLRAMAYAGFQPDDAHFTKALSWLIERPELSAVPGFQDADDPHGWAMSLRYYYYQSLADILRYLPETERDPWRRRLLQQVIQLQQDDGSWENTAIRNREDDPLVATSLCMAVLGALLHRL